MTRTFIVAAAVATLFATGAAAQRWYNDRDHDQDRDRGYSVGGVILKSFVGHAGDCSVIVTRRRAPDGAIVETRRRECD